MQWLKPVPRRSNPPLPRGKHLKIELENTGAVAVITLDRPERRNALSLQLMQELLRLPE